MDDRQNSGCLDFMFRAFFEKWMPVIISAAMLASLNHWYWNDRNAEEMETREFGRRVDAVIALNKHFSAIVEAVNSYVNVRDSDVPEEEKLARDQAVGYEMTGFSVAATRVRLLFPSESTAELVEIIDLINSMHTDSIPAVSPTSELWTRYQRFKDSLYETMNQPLRR